MQSLCINIDTGRGHRSHDPLLGTRLALRYCTCKTNEKKSRGMRGQLSIGCQLSKSVNCFKVQGFNIQYNIAPIFVNRNCAPDPATGSSRHSPSYPTWFRPSSPA